MARLPRFVVAGVPLHLIQRGHNRSAVFRAEDDYQRYTMVLQDASHRLGCAIHAYVLMTNHVHLLLTPRDEAGPARLMQSVGRVYVQYVNERYRRTGTLWEGRYRATLVDSERYLLACSRYIELNPVRARMVEHPSQYRWSSYGHNAHGDRDSLITQHALYQALDSGSEDRRAAYRALFETQPEAEAIHAIRRATNRGTALGDAPFCEEIEVALRRRVTPPRHGGDRRSGTFQSKFRGTASAGPGSGFKRV